ncbi:MAG: hypothetical protein ACOX6V_05725 [Patescibacteria group bacterium]|jgi:hypothetical protein
MLQKKDSQPTNKIIQLFISLRFLTLVAAGIGLLWLKFKPSFPYWDTVLVKYGSPLLWSWANFDGVHYLNLAKDGYTYGASQAFFPAYFLFIRGLTIVTQDALLSSLLISHLFFVASLWMFYKLLRLDYSKKVANRALLYLTFFPTSFYFLSAYTESLFLFLTLAVFYGIRTKRWKLAALAGIVATATKVTGVFLIPAFLYELHQNKLVKETVSNKYKTIITRVKIYVKSNFHLLWGIVPLIGLLAYMHFLNTRFNDPLMFVHVQESFGAGRQTDTLILLYQVFWRYFKMFVTVDKHNPIYFTIWLEFLSTISFIALFIWGYIKKVRVSYFIYAVPALLLPTLTGMLSSMPRYVLVLFPGFIALSLVENKRFQWGILAVFSLLLVICTALFTRGYWIS